MLQGRWSGRRYRSLRFQCNQQDTHMKHLQTHTHTSQGLHLTVQLHVYILLRSLGLSHLQPLICL